jgi:flagellar L-ring protein precursor FlgH
MTLTHIIEQSSPRNREWPQNLALFIMLMLAITQPSWAINLFEEERYRPLIADRKASLPGDILTVIVLETSNAQTSADLSSGKEIKTALEVGYNKNNHEVEFGLKGKGHTAAKTGRNGKIKASLTVRIKEIFPNSTYLVEGLQMITINGEQQKILLSGVVRPEDISPQNTILSTRLADAHITYSGNGSVSDSQNRNYFYKVLSFVGLV